MATRANTTESNEILKIIGQAILEAHAINQYVEDPDMRTALRTFLKNLEDDTTTFFRENVDRRSAIREKGLLDDMISYYQVSRSYIANYWPADCPVLSPLFFRNQLDALLTSAVNPGVRFPSDLFLCITRPLLVPALSSFWPNRSFG
jgi:hypothetical protein